MAEGYPMAVMPLPLLGAKAIAKAFEVHENTVHVWRNEGAPIAFAGRKYQAEYSALQAWLVIWSRNKQDKVVL